MRAFCQMPADHAAGSETAPSRDWPVQEKVGDLTIAHELPASVLLRSVAGGRAYLRSTSTSRPVTAKRMRAHSTPSLGITPLPSPRPCCATPRSPWPRSPDAWGSCPRLPPFAQGAHRRPGRAVQLSTAMPIKPELRYYYPIDWPQVSRWVRFVRAKGRCEACGRPHGQVVRHLATVAGGTKCSRPGAMAVAARSLALPRPRSSRAERPRSCWRQPISTTTLATAVGATATSRRFASGVICSTTGPSIAAASGSPCAGVGPWAICSWVPIHPGDLDELGHASDVQETVAIWTV